VSDVRVFALNTEADVKYDSLQYIESRFFCVSKCVEKFRPIKDQIIFCVSEMLSRCCWRIN